MIVDHFTRFVQAYPTRNKSPKIAATHLYDDFINRFGLPARILYDQGKEFENDLFRHIQKVNRYYKFKINSISSRMQRNCGQDEPDHTEHNAYFGRSREIPLEVQFKQVSTCIQLHQE